MQEYPPCMEKVGENEYRCTLGVLRRTVRTQQLPIHCRCDKRPDSQEDYRKAMAADVRARIMAQVYRRHVVDPAVRTLLEIEAILDERAANGLTGYDGCGCSGLDEFVTKLLYRDKEVRRK